MGQVMRLGVGGHGVYTSAEEARGLEPERPPPFPLAHLEWADVEAEEPHVKGCRNQCVAALVHHRGGEGGEDDEEDGGKE